MAEKSIAALWADFHRLSELYVIERQASVDEVFPTRIREFRRGLFKGRSYFSVRLWSEGRDPDSRSQPNAYYLTENRRLARGSDADAVDLLDERSLSDHYMRPILSRSVKALADALALMNEEKRPKVPSVNTGGIHVAWRSPIEGSRRMELVGFAALPGGHVAAGFSSGRFEVEQRFRIDVLDAETGAKTRGVEESRFGIFPKPGASLGGISFDRTSLYVILNCGGFGELYCLDGLNFDVRWQRQLAGAATAQPAAGNGRSDVVVGDMSGRVSSFDKQDGSINWEWQGGALAEVVRTEWDHVSNEEYAITAPSHAISSAVISGDRVIFNHATDGTYCLDRTSGELIWRCPQRSQAWVPPSVLDSLVLISDASGNIFALEPDSGRIVWRRHVGDSWVSTAEQVEGVAYLASASTYSGGSSSGTISAVALDGGRILWQSESKFWNLDAPREMHGQLLLGGRVYESAQGSLVMDMAGAPTTRSLRIGDGVIAEQGGDIVLFR